MSLSFFLSETVHTNQNLSRLYSLPDIISDELLARKLITTIEKDPELTKIAFANPADQPETSSNFWDRLQTVDQEFSNELRKAYPNIVNLKISAISSRNPEARKQGPQSISSFEEYDRLVNTSTKTKLPSFSEFLHQKQGGLFLKNPPFSS